MKYDEMTFFIDSFIRKDKRERCALLLLKNSRDSLRKLSQGIPKWLTSSCEYYAVNALEHYLRATHPVQNLMAYVTDFESVPKRLHLVDYHPMDFTDELVIVPDDNLAFFFHHHGGIWICRV